MSSEFYKSGLLTKSVRFMSLLLAIVFFLYGLFYLAIGLIALTNISKYGFLPFFNGLIYFGLLGFFVPVFLLLISDFYRPLVVDPKGLHTKFFGKSIDVSWDDIVGIRPVKLFGLIKLRNKYIILTKNSLTILHRIYGVFFGGTRRSILPLNPSIHDDPTLIEKISKRVKQNRQLNASRGKAAA